MTSRQQEVYVGDSKFSPVSVPTDVPTTTIFGGKASPWGANIGEDDEDS
jgi:hypothetical protein